MTFPQIYNDHVPNNLFNPLINEGTSNMVRLVPGAFMGTGLDSQSEKTYFLSVRLR